MNKAKKANRDILRFVEVGVSLLERCSGESELKFALTTTLASCRKAVVEYDSQLGPINIKHASLDSNGDLRQAEQGGFVYTPEHLTRRNNEHRTLLDKEVEIEVYLIDPKKKLPIELNGLQEDAVAGFILPVVTKPPVEAVRKRQRSE